MQRQVTPPEAKQLMDEDGYTYLDVRTEQEFVAGHPAGSINIPAFIRGAAGMMPNPEFVPTVQEKFGPDTKLVVGCQMGGRSSKAIEMLSQVGYSDLYNVVGGFGGAQDPATGDVIDGWRDSGLPVETGE